MVQGLLNVINIFENLILKYQVFNVSDCGIDEKISCWVEKLYSKLLLNVYKDKKKRFCKEGIKITQYN